MSGSNATSGLDQVRGIQYAVDTINKSGGIKSMGGAQLQLVLADHKNDANVGLTEAERLINQENVSLIIGLASTAVGIAVAPLGDKYKVPMLDTASTADQIYPMKLSYYRTMGVAASSPNSVFRQPANLVVDLKKNSGISTDRIAISSADNTGGRSASDAIVSVLTAAGLAGNIVLNQFYDPSQANQAPTALKIQAANPDVLIGYSTNSDFVALVKAFNANGFQPKIWSLVGPSPIDPAMPAALGSQLTDAALHQPGIFGTTHYSEGMAAIYPPAAAFVKSFKEWAVANKLPTEIPEYSFVGATATFVVQKLLEDTGSANRIALNDGFHKMNLPLGSPYLIDPEYTPGLSWDAVGRCNSGYLSIGQWIKDTGKLEIVFPKTSATHAPWLK